MDDAPKPFPPDLVSDLFQEEGTGAQYNTEQEQEHFLEEAIQQSPAVLVMDRQDTSVFLFRLAHFVDKLFLCKKQVASNGQPHDNPLSLLVFDGKRYGRRSAREIKGMLEDHSVEDRVEVRVFPMEDYQTGILIVMHQRGQNQ